MDDRRNGGKEHETPPSDAEKFVVAGDRMVALALVLHDVSWGVVRQCCPCCACRYSDGVLISWVEVCISSFSCLSVPFFVALGRSALRFLFFFSPLMKHFADVKLSTDTRSESAKPCGFLRCLPSDLFHSVLVFSSSKSLN